LLQTAWEHEGPALVRYPRGTGIGTTPADDLPTLPWGRGEIRREGSGIAILSFGTLIDRALAVGEALDATVANMRFVKPLDEALVRALAREHAFLVTLEENVVAGGAGAGVSEFLAAQGLEVPLLHFGLPDRYIEQATQDEQLREAGLDVPRILAAIREHLPVGLVQRAG
jgi:1-deoxy-D-xylulose-5-phosphate synthase